jgi:hypothetical protein
MEQGIPPICQAMVLCDGLHQSPSTGRMSLLETIGNRLLAADFPQTWSPIAVYLVLTSGHGSTALTLRWTGPDGEPLPGSEQQLEVDFADPLEMHEVFFFCDGLVFPEPGEYRLELIVAGEIVTDRRLFVHSPSG